MNAGHISTIQMSSGHILGRSIFYLEESSSSLLLCSSLFAKTCLCEKVDLIHRPEKIAVVPIYFMFQRSKVDEYVDSRNIYTRRHDGVTLKIPKPNKESLKKSRDFQRG